MIVISSCSSQKQMTSANTKTKTSTITSLDSLLQRASIAEDVEISWNFDEDTGTNGEPNKGSEQKPLIPSSKKPPKKGTVRMRITKRAEVVNVQTKVEKKEQQTQTQKAKKKQNNNLKVKKQENNIFINALFIIIFFLIVKYVFAHKNNLKKVWNLLKKKITLHHPQEHRSNAEERL